MTTTQVSPTTASQSSTTTTMAKTADDAALKPLPQMLWQGRPDPRVYVRDLIVVDDAFEARLAAIVKRFEHDATTLTFVARQIKHERVVC